MYGAYAKQYFRDKLIEHRQYIMQFGDDPPEIRDWQWTAREKVSPTDGIAARNVAVAPR
jgi:hypothetical protein